MHPYYNRDGEPITMSEWGALAEDLTYRIVEQTEIGEEVEVSTVWLGIDHGFVDDVPLIFETMVFGGKHDQFQQRYPTEDLALFGHQEVVERVSKDEAKTFLDRWLRKVKRVRPR